MASGSMQLLIYDGGFFILSAAVLSCYEHIITLGEEVQCIWRRRISGASVLFVINRYATLAVALASIVQVLPWSPVPGLHHHHGHHPIPHGIYDEICSSSILFVDACLLLASLAYAVFAALRMSALYGVSKPVFTLVLLLGLLNSFAQIFLISVETIRTDMYRGGVFPIGDNGLGRLNCYHAIHHKARALFGRHIEDAVEILFPVLRFHALVFEGLLIGLTWSKTFARRSLQKTVIRTPITTMLLRDGTLYFTAIAAASALNLFGMTALMCILFSDDPHHSRAYNLILPLACSSPMVDAITSICMSRFILNLVGLTVARDDGMTSTQFRSTQWKPTRPENVAETIVRDMDADQHDEFPEDNSEGEDDWDDGDEDWDRDKDGVGDAIH